MFLPWPHADPSGKTHKNVRRRYRFRVYWHCLWRVSLLDYDHQMCYVTFFHHDPTTRLYYCSCGHLEREAWKLWDSRELELPSGAAGQFKDGAVS